MIESFENKRILFAFSDPAGAKSLLAFCELYGKLFSAFKILSNRLYPFYVDFRSEVTIVTDVNVEIENIINDFQPNVIFTATSYPAVIELACLRIAKTKQNIRTFSFVDHWTNFKIRFEHEDTLVLPDHIFVIDEVAKSKANQEGLPESIITIFGNPYYVYLNQWTPAISRNDFENILGKSFKYILFVPEPLSEFKLEEKYGFDEFRVLSFLVKSILTLQHKKVIESLTLVFKCHPNHKWDEVMSKLTTLFTKDQLSNIVVLTESNISLNTLIYFSEAVVGIFSNSLVESTFLGKKTAQVITFLKNSSLNPLMHVKGLTIIETESQMNKFLNK